MPPSADTACRRRYSVGRDQGRPSATRLDQGPALPGKEHRASSLQFGIGSIRPGFLRLLLGLAWIACGAPACAAESWKLFLLIGQSNMAGRGAVEAADRVPHPRVFMLDRDLAWVPAVDPMHFDKPEIAGVGLGSTFARVVAERFPGATIGLIPAAFGGTSLDQWAPGGELYTGAVRRAREARRRGELAGILWHQGEADRAGEKTRTYAARFAAMMARLRRDLGAEDVPVIVGELGRFRPENAAMNAVLAGLPATVPRCAFVDAAGLTDQGDRTHFDAPSLRLFGRRYAEAWLRLAESSAP